MHEPMMSFVLRIAKCSVSKRFPRGPGVSSPAPSPVSATSGVATRSALDSPALALHYAPWIPVRVLGVDEHVEDVHDEVGDQDGGDDEEEQALQQEVVAVLECSEDQRADPRIAEDDLRHAVRPLRLRRERGRVRTSAAGQRFRTRTSARSLLGAPSDWR